MHTYDAAVLRAAGVPALGVTALAAGVAAVVDGASGAGGALVAGAMVSAVFGMTMWLCSRTRSSEPAAAMAVAVGSYVVKVVLLGLVLVLFGSTSPLSGDAFPLTMVAVTLAWMTGEVYAFSTLRTPYVEPAGWVTAAPVPSRRPVSARSGS